MVQDFLPSSFFSHYTCKNAQHLNPMDAGLLLLPLSLPQAALVILTALWSNNWP
jgi:hypothetical protein